MPGMKDAENEAEDYKSKVKQWLDDFRHSREWLADQCDSNKRTVDNWLSSPRPIPRHATNMINTLMAQDYDKMKANVPPAQNIVLEVSRDQFNAYNRAANSKGQLIYEWVNSVLNDAANPEISDNAEFLAEEPAKPEKKKKPVTSKQQAAL